MSQSPDRGVDFSENRFDNPCGCLMVQYGIENNIKFDFVGTAYWGTYFTELRKSINFTSMYRLQVNSKYYDFCEKEDSCRKTTYKNLQEYCRKHYNLETGEKVNENNC